MVAFLRDGPEAVAHLDVEQLEADRIRAAETGDVAAEFRASRLIAEWSRAHGHDARPMADRAVYLAYRTGEERATVIARLTRATAWFYQGEHDRAEQELRVLIAENCQTGDPVALDFCYQHLGKCLAEMGRYTEAMGAFRVALGQRHDPELRASTLAALSQAETALRTGRGA